MLHAVQQSEPEIGEAARAYALPANLFGNIDTFEIDRVCRFRNDIGFEDELAILENNKDPFLLDASCNSFEEPFTIADHWVGAALDKRNLTLSPGYLLEFFHSRLAYRPLAFMHE